MTNNNQLETIVITKAHTELIDDTIVFVIYANMDGGDVKVEILDHRNIITIMKKCKVKVLEDLAYNEISREFIQSLFEPS